MIIVTKVKDVDDFGKKKINGNVYEYSHHDPRVNNGDFLIYFYPEDNAIGIYQAKEELEYYYKDGFQYCRGKMHRYEKSALDFIEMARSISDELAETFEKTMNDLIDKHSRVVSVN